MNYLLIRTLQKLRPVLSQESILMPTLTPFHKTAVSLYRFAKEIYQHSLVKAKKEKTILFILGCQRSGTSVLLRTFDRDIKAKIYHERSKLTSNDLVRGIRLNSLESIQRELDKDRAVLIILKPLVESQNAVKLLNHFKESKVLWMYRHYQDVAASNIRRFRGQNGVKNLIPIVEDSPDNWRSENLSDSIRQIVAQYYSEDMNPHDAAALFWYVRNSLFFNQNLDQDPRVLMCEYKELVTHPSSEMRRIYEILGLAFPGNRLVAEINRKSLAKGKNTRISPEIDCLCRELWRKLSYHKQYLRQKQVQKAY